MAVDWSKVREERPVDGGLWIQTARGWMEGYVCQQCGKELLLPSGVDARPHPGSRLCVFWQNEDAALRDGYVEAGGGTYFRAAKSTELVEIAFRVLEDTHGLNRYFSLPAVKLVLDCGGDWLENDLFVDLRLTLALRVAKEPLLASLIVSNPASLDQLLPRLAGDDDAD